MKVDIHELYKE